MKMNREEVIVWGGMKRKRKEWNRREAKKKSTRGMINAGLDRKTGE